MMPVIAHSKPLRTDIQALRGLAVLAVLVYHLDSRLVPAGYLGVDIFFVVSGFLIASLIVREMDAGTFRFSHFYFRRAKRLLPAAYATFLLVALVAPWLIGEWELAGLARQTRAAVTFTANHYFLRQSG